MNWIYLFNLPIFFWAVTSVYLDAHIQKWLSKALLTLIAVSECGTLRNGSYAKNTLRIVKL